MLGICAVAEQAAFQKFRLERADPGDRISAADSAECDVSGCFAVTEGKIKGVYIAGGAYFSDLGVVDIDIASAKQRFDSAVFYFKIAGGADVFVFAFQMAFAECHYRVFHVNASLLFDSLCFSAALHRI